MASISIRCPSCSATEGVVRNGKSTAGHQRYLCSHCRKTWQLQFTYTASQPGTHQKIIDMAMNGVGCRASARIMGVGLNTVLRHFKKLRPQSVTSRIQPGSDVIVCAEMDEQWGYVAYDTRLCHDELRRKKISALIPPRKGAGYWPGEYADRNRAVANQRMTGSNARWKWTTEYNRRSIAETAMYRMKQLLGDSLTLRDYDGQVAEAMALVRALNKMTKAGMPESVRIA
ncbi:IS1 family transposase [Klebsiella quasipneumoniae]|uniref:IS1 family transposase n=1 Tax=Klebsiella quasipneumoniae TaxID=1463165 RepID=UPI0039E3FCF1